MAATVMSYCIWLETAPWVVLGPLNIFKVAYVNRGSPISAYIVVQESETCQAACKIARMWACLFWGLQTMVAVAILRREIAPRLAATAKLFVGMALVAGYVEGAVRVPVAMAGACELATGLCCLAGATASYPLGFFRLGYRRLRKFLAQFGVVWFVVHWLCYGLTISAFYVAIGNGVDVVQWARSLPVVGDQIAAKVGTLDVEASGLARFSVAWACAFATAPLRLFSDALLTLLVGTLLLRLGRNRAVKAD